MMRYKIALKNREKDPKAWQEFYESEIVRLIRQRYNVNQELSILRQRDEKPEEFAEYSRYVEECKAIVKDAVRKAEGGAT